MKSVLITGAGRGFGKSLLDLYLNEGWTVFPLVRNVYQLEEAIKKFPGRCHPIVGDITSDKTENEIQRVLKWNTGQLDLLINNAGNIIKNRDFENTNADDLLNLFNVHCAGVFRCTKASFPFLLKSKKPVVINISSRWGSIAKTAAGGGGDIYSYSIAKSAQNMLSALLHNELKEKNISVHSVHPGKLLTAAAAADADVNPAEAALKLFNWIENIPPDLECCCYDIINNEVIKL